MVLNLPMRKPDLTTENYDVSVALKQEGLNQQDYEEICRRLARKPNRTELGMFGVMWSEHCCYRNSKPLLSQFPTKSSYVLVGPGENAGVVDLGEGQRLAFKIESHNHPSAVEPFQGAATGVGGILRDIFTMGARPIALLNALRFGPLDDDKNISLMEGVVAGIAHYGNCVGVPTVGGEVSFDKSYTGNPLVNAMALGLMETEDIVCSGADGIDFPVVYVGSTTGRDGMGGASFASSELSNKSLDDRPAVQVGDPFLEKGLIEACLQAFKSGDVVAAQDMGAAGLTCSCSEMASKGGLGIELNLDLVPAREEGMTAYEYLLSESQERMLFVVKPGKEKDLMNEFTKWGLTASVVGKVLKENIVRVVHNGLIAAELPASALADDTPVNYHQLIQDPPAEISNHWRWKENELGLATDKEIILSSTEKLSWNNVILRLLDNPNISSKKWVYRQYDQQVQSNTIISPGEADAAVIRLRSQTGDISNSSINRAVAAVVDCPNRWVYLDPERGSIAAVAEASRNLTCVGAKPLAVTDNLNFCSPDTDIGYWQLASSCKGISTACKVMKTPVTGGNVSLYNDTRLSNGTLQPIHPTPVIGMVGLIEDITKICSKSWLNLGDLVLLIGNDFEVKDFNDEIITLSGSSYLESIHKLISGRPPEIDLEFEYLTQNFIRSLITKGYVQSAHDVSDGGLAIALAESTLTSGFGVDINLPKLDVRMDKILFAEGGTRILISIKKENFSFIQAQLDSFNRENNCLVSITNLGEVSKDKSFLIRQNQVKLIELTVENLVDVYEGSLPNRINKKN